MPAFELPYLLLLLPAALLPLWPRRQDDVAFPYTAWIPADKTGRSAELVWRSLGALTIVCLLIALAAPGIPEAREQRIGRGAELMVLLDRSASMDTIIRRNAPKPGEAVHQTQTKNDVVREAMSWLLDQRPNNRYALTLFNVVPMPVAPFTDDAELVRAAVNASGIGRGPKKTNMGLALLSAIDSFAHRDYTGSRSILLVSDGGARLDKATRAAIKTGLKKNRINLYFIYIEGGFVKPNFDTVGTDPDSLMEEVALHVFFRTMGVEYQVFQADDLDSMSAAIKLIDEQQNLPLIYWQRIPRVDYSRSWYVAALIFCALLLALSLMRVESLR